MIQPVLQEWVMFLPMMQQSVLIAAVRGPDGIKKDHVSKLMMRWFRRCMLLSSFIKDVIANPYDPGGGSFTGPSIAHVAPNWEHEMGMVVSRYLKTIDELPHHYQLHFMHACEILGYKHPDERIKAWWLETYLRIVRDMHLYPETEKEMDKRLGDNYEGWNERNDPSDRADGPRHVET